MAQAVVTSSPPLAWGQRPALESTLVELLRSVADGRDGRETTSTLKMDLLLDCRSAV